MADLKIPMLAMPAPVDARLQALSRFLVDGDGSRLQAVLPFLPLDNPLLPAVGDDFCSEAERLGATDAKKFLTYLYVQAMYDPSAQLTVYADATSQVYRLLPGHRWGLDSMPIGKHGPTNGAVGTGGVMVLGKHPGRDELKFRRNFVGPTSELLVESLDALGVNEQARQDWYTCNVLRWQPEARGGAIPAAWIRDCLPILWQEIMLMQPSYILCLGADAARAVLKQTGKVDALLGRVFDRWFTIESNENSSTEHLVRVMALTHPAELMHKPEKKVEFRQGLNVFVRMVNGDRAIGRVTTVGKDYRVVKTEEDLAKIVDEVLAVGDNQMLALDAEWHGEAPTEPGSYIRTVQFSHSSGFACCVVLHEAGGSPAFSPGTDAAVRQLKRLTEKQRIGGHFFRADLPWLKSIGLDLYAQYAAPVSFTDVRTAGGWDVSLMAHAVTEAATFKLEILAARLLGIPRYDEKLLAWKKRYCLEHKLKPDELEGYGDCPDDILYDYGNGDADVTITLAHKYTRPGGLLDNDQYGQQSWRAYWTSHSASLAFLEMEDVGMAFDSVRADSLRELFSTAYADELATLREMINWSNFNPGSHYQCRELLFGIGFSNKKLKAGAAPPVDGIIRVSPEGAILQGLTPIKSTGKRGKAWGDAMARHVQERGTPPVASTDKETLGILGQSNQAAKQLRSIKFLKQVITTVLKPPKIDKKTKDIVRDANGRPVYAKGLASFIRADGRVHPHMSQNKETGRASCSRPNLQAISSKREEDYQRILGDKYTWPIKSVFVASPGHCLVSADYSGAELAVTAWLSGDVQMIEHIRRMGLGEKHPDYYDIHSSMAVAAFGLTCPPTKKGLKDAGKKDLRVAAKNVVFGSLYGRSAEPIARQCAEEGSPIAVEQAEALQAKFFSIYSTAADFFERCRQRVASPGWIMNPFGRIRRFMPSNDRSVQGEQERQAMNAPIQGTVADAMSLALNNLRKYREIHATTGLAFRILLQVHDAVLLEVPDRWVATVVKEVLPACLVNQVPICPTTLDGVRIPNVGPYHFSIDTDIYRHWGEAVDDLEPLGL